MIAFCKGIRTALDFFLGIDTFLKPHAFINTRLRKSDSTLYKKA
jgi:hypothetical protein